MKTYKVTLSVQIEAADESLDAASALENADVEITFGTTEERDGLKVSDVSVLIAEESGIL
jgi:hypothetical protein